MLWNGLICNWTLWIFRQISRNQTVRFEKKKTWEIGNSIDRAAATVKKNFWKKEKGKRNTQSNYDKQIWGAGVTVTCRVRYKNTPRVSPNSTPTLRWHTTFVRAGTQTKNNFLQKLTCPFLFLSLGFHFLKFQTHFLFFSFSRLVCLD